MTEPTTIICLIFIVAGAFMFLRLVADARSRAASGLRARRQAEKLLREMQQRELERSAPVVTSDPA